VSNRLGNPQPFFPKGPALGERAQLGMAPGEVGTGLHGGQDDIPEALVAPRPIEGRHSLPEAVDRLTIVALELVGHAQGLVRQRLQDDIPAGRGEREGTLGGGDGLVIRTHIAEMDGQKTRDLSQPTRVVEGRGEGFGLAQNRQNTPRVARRKECRTQGEPEINGLLTCGALLWQVGKDAERLLVVPCRLAVGRPCQGLLPRLPKVCQGLSPHLAPQGMVRQALELFGHPVPGERLKGLDDTGMQHPPPLPQETAIGALVREGVLEGVLALWEEARFVQELGRLEVRQAAMQRRLGQLGNRLQQGQGDLRANDGDRLQEALFLGRQAVDARRQHRLHRGRHLDGGQCLRQAIGAWRANQHARLDQGPHALLQEERIPLRALDQEPFQRYQTGIISQEDLEKFIGTCRRERVEPQLRVIGLVAPAVPILRAIVDQQEEAGRGQALDQTLQQGLGFGIDPVQIFTDEQHRLHLALTQEHPLERLERALAALGRIEGAEGAVLGQGV
jgi:hypothetical protein